MVYHRPTRSRGGEPALDRIFASLSDPTRRAILARLAVGEATITDLASRFDMTLPAVSKHVKVLERAGLARIRRDGRSRRTRLVAAPLREARDWIETYRGFWEFQLDRLASFLEETAPVSSPTDQEEDSCPSIPKPPSPSRYGERSPRRDSASSRRGRGRRR